MSDLCREFAKLPDDKKKSVAEAAILAFIGRGISDNTLDLFTLKTFLDDAEKAGYIQSQRLKDYKRQVDALADVYSELDLLQRELSSYTMYVQNNEFGRVNTNNILNRLNQVKQKIDKAKSILSQDIMSKIEDHYKQLHTLGTEIVNVVTTLNKLKHVFKAIDDASNYISQKMSEIQGAPFSSQARIFTQIMYKAGEVAKTLSSAIDSLRSERDRSVYFKDLLNAYINMLQTVKESFLAILRFSDIMSLLLSALDDFMDAVNNYGDEARQYYLNNPEYTLRVMYDIKTILTYLGKLKSLANELQTSLISALFNSLGVPQISGYTPIGKTPTPPSSISALLKINKPIDQKVAMSLITSINDVYTTVYNYMSEAKKNLISNDYRWYDYRIFQQAEQFAVAEGGVSLPTVTPQSTERFPGEYYFKHSYSRIRDLMERSSISLRSADIGAKIAGGIGLFISGMLTALYSLTPSGIIDNWNQLVTMIRGTQEAINKYGLGEGLRRAGWQLLVDMFGTPERAISFVGQVVAWYIIGKAFSSIKLGKIPVGDIILNLLQADPYGMTLVALDMAGVKGKLRTVLKKSYDEGKPIARIVGSEVLENAIKNSIGEDLVKRANLKVSKSAMNVVLAGLRNIAENPEAINEKIRSITRGVREVGIEEARKTASLFQRSFTALRDMVNPKYFTSALKELGQSQLVGLPKKLMEAFGKVAEVPASRLLNVVDDLRNKITILSHTIADLELVYNNLSKLVPRNVAEGLAKTFEAIKKDLASGRIDTIKLSLDEISRKLHGVVDSTIKGLEILRDKVGSISKIIGDETVARINSIINEAVEDTSKNPFNITKHISKIVGELDNIKKAFEDRAMQLLTKLQEYGVFMTEEQKNQIVRLRQIPKEVEEQIELLKKPEVLQTADELNKVFSKMNELGNVILVVTRTIEDLSRSFRKIKVDIAEVVQMFDQRLARSILDSNPDNFFPTLKNAVTAMVKSLDKSRVPIVMKLVNVVKTLAEDKNISPILRSNLHEFMTYTKNILSGYVDIYLQDYVRRITAETGAMKLRTLEDVGNRLDVVRDIVGDDVVSRAKQRLSRGFEGLGDLRKMLYDIHGELSKFRNDLLNTARNLGQNLKSLVPSITDADIEGAIRSGVASKEMVAKIFDSGIAEAFDILDKFNEVISKLRRLENVAVDIFNLAKGIDDYIGEIKNVAGKLVTSPEIKSRIANITPDNIDAVLKSVFDENVKNPKAIGDLASLYVALRQLFESEKLPDIVKSGLSKVVNYIEDRLNEAMGAKVCDIASRLSQWVLQEERLLRSLPSDVIDEIRYLKNLADTGRLTLGDLLRVTDLLGRIAPILTSEMELNMFRSILSEIQDYINMLKESGVTRNVLDIVGKVGSKIQEINISLTQRKPGEVGGPAGKMVTIDIKEYRPIMPEFVNGLLQIKDTITKYFKDVATKYNVEESVNTILRELERGELTKTSVDAANNLMKAILEMSGVAKPPSLRGFLSSVKDFARKVWDKVEDLYRKRTMSESEYYGWKAFKELADVIQRDLENGYMLPEGWGYLDLSVEYVKSRPIVIPESMRPKIMEELSRTRKASVIKYGDIEIKAERIITQVGNTLRIDYIFEFPGGRKAVYSHVVRTIGRDSKGNIIGAVESKFMYDPPLDDVVAIYRSGDTSNPLYRVGEVVTRMNQNIEDFIRRFDDSYDVIKNIGVITEGGKISTIGSAMSKLAGYALTAMYATASLTNLFKKPESFQLPQLQLWLSTLTIDKTNLINTLQPYLKPVDPEVDEVLKSYGLSGVAEYKGDKINLVLAGPTGREMIGLFKEWTLLILPDLNMKILAPVLNIKGTPIVVLPTLNVPADVVINKLKEVSEPVGTPTISPDVLQNPDQLVKQVQKQGVLVKEITITIPTTQQTAQVTPLPSPTPPPTETITQPTTIPTPPQGTELPSAYGYGITKTGYQYEILVI